MKLLVFCVFGDVLCWRSKFIMVLRFVFVVVVRGVRFFFFWVLRLVLVLRRVLIIVIWLEMYVE